MILLTALVLESLYNTELLWIGRRLHDDPIDGLLVLFVHLAGFDEFALDLFNVFRLAAEVADQSVNHVCAEMLV